MKKAMQCLYDNWMKAATFWALYSYLALCEGAELHSIPDLASDSDLLVP